MSALRMKAVVVPVRWLSPGIANSRPTVFCEMPNAARCRLPWLLDFDHNPIKVADAHRTCVSRSLSAFPSVSKRLSIARSYTESVMKTPLNFLLWNDAHRFPARSGRLNAFMYASTMAPPAGGDIVGHRRTEQADVVDKGKPQSPAEARQKLGADDPAPMSAAQRKDAMRPKDLASGSFDCFNIDLKERT